MTLFSRNRDRAERDEPPVLRCSFCNKSQRDVRKLIAGPMVWICDECVDICFNIIQEEKEKPGSLQEQTEPRRRELADDSLSALRPLPNPVTAGTLQPHSTARRALRRMCRSGARSSRTRSEH